MLFSALYSLIVVDNKIYKQKGDKNEKNIYAHRCDSAYFGICIDGVPLHLRHPISLSVQKPLLTINNAKLESEQTLIKKVIKLLLCHKVQL